MSAFSKLDWDAILQPLPGDSPCGPDLQYDAAYDAIRRSRQGDRDSLPSGLWERQEKKTDWDGLGVQCFELLTQRSKDLQVSAWLVEILVYSQGLGGAVRGFTLFTELTIRFWEDIHPRIENDDVDLRLRPVNWLLREGLKWFSREVPFFPDADQPAAPGHEPHSLWQALSAELKRLDEFLTEKVPEHSPAFREIHRCLELQLLGTSPPALQTLDGVKLSPLVQPAGSLSRDSAYAQLKEIAEFLSRTEPHSPVPMVLLSLVTWRDVRFDELLERLPAQGGASLYELLRLFKASATQ